MKKVYIIIGLFITLFPSSIFANPEIVFNLINNRLQYMQEVAIYKANNKKAIEDTVREASILNQLSTYAVSLGLERESVVTFLQAQMSVSKAIQCRYFVAWGGGVPKIFVDLEKVRIDIDNMDKKMFEEIAVMVKGIGFEKTDIHIFNQRVNAQNLSQDDKDKIFDSLLLIK